MLWLITWKAINVPNKTAAQWEVFGKAWCDSIHWHLFSAFTIILNKRDELRYREKLIVFRKKSKRINKAQKTVALPGWKIQVLLVLKNLVNETKIVWVINVL